MIFLCGNVLFCADLFLVILDRQFEPGELIIALLIKKVGIVSVVQNHLELSGAARLVQQVFGKLFTLTGQLLILRLEFILHLKEMDSYINLESRFQI